jgi:hypothetical protein
MLLSQTSCYIVKDSWIEYVDVAVGEVIEI